MSRNVGVIDRIIRLLIAAGALWLFFTGERPAWEYAVLVVGVIMLLTAIIGVCPAYSLLGIGKRNKRS
jgi:hypothetical protein